MFLLFLLFLCLLFVYFIYLLFSASSLLIFFYSILYFSYSLLKHQLFYLFQFIITLFHYYNFLWLFFNSFLHLLKYSIWWYYWFIQNNLYSFINVLVIMMLCIYKNIHFLFICWWLLMTLFNILINQFIYIIILLLLLILISLNKHNYLKTTLNSLIDICVLIDINDEHLLKQHFLVLMINIVNNFLLF